MHILVIIFLFILYEIVGITLMILLTKYSNSSNLVVYYDEDDSLIIFALGFIWPLILFIWLCSKFTEKVVTFVKDILERIETIKEEREMEDK